MEILRRAFATEQEDPLLLCAICLGQLKEPRCLQCKHVFCLQCLKDYNIIYYSENQASRSHTQILFCPVCASPHELSNTDVSLKALHSKGPIGVGDAIRVFSETPNVSFQPGEINSDSNVANLHSAICKLFLCKRRKNDCQMSYYCHSCQLPLCARCSAGAHAGHEITTMGDDQARVARVVEQTLIACGKIEDLLQKHMARKKDLHSLLKAQEKQYEKTKNDIQRHSETLVKQIRRREQKLIESLDEDRQKKEQAVKREIEDTAKALAEAKLYQRNVANLSPNSGGLPARDLALVVLNHVTINGKLNKLDSTLSHRESAIKENSQALALRGENNLNIGTLEKCSVSFGVEREIPVQPDEQPGILSCNPVWRYDFGMQTNPTPTGVLFVPNSDDLLVACPTLCKIIQFSSSGESYEEVLTNVNLSITRAGGWITQGNPNRNYQRELGFVDKVTPYCLAHMVDKVAFTDQMSGTVHFLDARKSYTHVDSLEHRCFAKYLNTPGCVAQPFGLAYVPHKQRLFVTDTAQKRLYSVDVTTKQVISATRGGLLTGPQFIHYDTCHDRLLVTDNSVVKVFSTDGQVGATLCSHNSALSPWSEACHFSGLFHPGAAITDSRGNIFVSNNFAGEKSIAIFDSNGCFIKNLDMPRGERLSYPYGLAFSDNRKLAITNKDTGDIVVVDVR